MDVVGQDTWLELTAGTNVRQPGLPHAGPVAKRAALSPALRIAAAVLDHKSVDGHRRSRVIQDAASL
ncbi:hypothetical protein AB0E08_47440 [Streptomyces sp. NPDC048281]|uniref:hypothetical protein n=1 Tax=Streptomyces sp. NPDC048281 TaxID=3154715 RepID=UPI00341C7668